MYESPIEIFQHKIRTDISSHVDDAIYTAVVRTDIHVDRDELIKALSYDRGQYDKGFSDGLEEGKPKWISVKDRLPKVKTHHKLNYTDNTFTSSIRVLCACRQKRGERMVKEGYGRSKECCSWFKRNAKSILTALNAHYVMVMKNALCTRWLAMVK